MTESVSIMKIEVMKTRKIMLPSNNAITPIVAPKASEPVSPIKKAAGGTLNHKKPSVAPTMVAHKAARMNRFWV